MTGIVVLMVVVCLAAAAILSLVIRSRQHGVAIMAVFLVPALIGLLVLDGWVGQYLAFGAGAGVVGCAGAIGTFRFWTAGTPEARAGVTVAVLAALIGCLPGGMYFGVQT